MRWLINLIRSWFCQHEMEVVSGTSTRYINAMLDDHIIPDAPTKVFYCKKCSYNFQRWC